MILALDVGDRYIGIAAGNPPETPIHRHGTIDRTQEDPFEALHDIVSAEAVDVIVVGLPVSLEEGNATEQTEKTEVFINELRAHIDPDVRIETIDETLTSAEAARHIKIEGAQADAEHAEAARIMLTEYLERIR